MSAPHATPYLLLAVADREVAVHRDAVRQILPVPHLHMPPATGGPLAGFLSLSGMPIPVLDLARLLGLRDEAKFDPYRHIVLCADGTTALLVDRALDMLSVEPDRVKPVENSRSLNGCVEGEIALDDRLIHLLALPRLLTAEERLRIDALTNRAADRLASFDAT